MKCSILSYIVTTLLFLLQFSITSSATVTSLRNSINKDYIRASCRGTTYYRLCLKSLSKHANKIKGDVESLAHTALNTTLLFTKYTSRMMKDMSKIHGLKPKEAAVLLDCLADINDSVEELQKSMKELDLADQGSDFGLQMIDIRTWIHTALEDENICLDVIAGTAMNPKVKSKIRKRITKAAHLTSNALALINNYALAKTKSILLTD